MVKKESYFCMSKRELPIKDLRYLSQNIGCSVGFVGKVGQDRWDYSLYPLNPLSEKDFEFIKEKGLIVLLSPKQSKSLANTLDLSKFADNVLM